MRVEDLVPLLERLDLDLVPCRLEIDSERLDGPDALRGRLDELLARTPKHQGGWICLASQVLILRAGQAPAWPDRAMPLSAELALNPLESLVAREDGQGGLVLARLREREARPEQCDCLRQDLDFIATGTRGRCFPLLRHARYWRLHPRAGFYHYQARFLGFRHEEDLT